jgi:hypothetical protein
LRKLVLHKKEKHLRTNPIQSHCMRKEDKDSMPLDKESMPEKWGHKTEKT